MSEDMIQCCECGQEFSVKNDGDMPVTGCPVCGTPLSDQINRKYGARDLKLRDNRSLSEDHKTCPSCEKLSPKQSRICTHCGYDWETGKHQKTSFQKKAGLQRYLGVILLLILFAGLGAWVFSALLSGNNPSTPSTDASPEKTSIQKLQEQDFEKWIANFEAVAPVFVAGQQARLELNSGQILSGEIQAIKNDFVLITTDQGTKEIPYSTLKPKSRASLDSEFRRDFIQNARDRIISP